jgi:hypothetical protein
MAKFRIVTSRRLGLENCEFDVIYTAGTVNAGEVFEILDRGTLWEYVVMNTLQEQGLVKLECVTWVPEDGAFAGVSAESFPMKAVHKRRYAKVLAKFKYLGAQ